MTNEEIAEMMGNLQGQTFALQSMVACLINKLSQKGILGFSECLEIRDETLAKLEEIQMQAESSQQWILGVAMDRVSQLFPRS